jgi:four helix bundle protein
MGRGMVKSFTDFTVYQNSLKLVRDVNSLCANIKGREYGFLKDQIRRASTSIVLNIAEGSGRWGKKEKMNFYRTSQASANECQAAIDIFYEYGLIEFKRAEGIKELLRHIINELLALIISVEKRGPV